MKLYHGPLFAALLFLVAGCATSEDKGAGAKPPTQTQPPDQVKNTDPAAVPETKIAAALAKLDKDDREAAEIQRFCAVQTKNRLGSMGMPPKIKIKFKDKAGAEEEMEVFLCCSHCETEARKDPAKTAARVAEMNIQGTLAKLSPEDRKAALAQKFCAAENDTRLGSMDAPVKVMLKDKDGKEQPVFFCCGGCQRIIKKEGPEKVLAIVEDLKKKNAAPAPQ